MTGDNDENPLANFTPETTDPESERYSTIFGRLVEDADDLVGIVAYGIYKQNKRNWLIRHKEKHKRRPTEIELEAYHDHFSDEDLRRLRSEAEELMLGFTEVIIDNRTPDIERAIVDGELRKLNQAISTAAGDIKSHVTKQTHPAWALVWNIAAWVLTLLITITVAATFLLPSLTDRLAEKLGRVVS